jgi:hypothetical protein
MKKKYNGQNEDNFSYTYAEGKKLMNERTLIKSIDHLIDLGFIRLVNQGRASGEPNSYAFSDQWQYFGTDNFAVIQRVKKRGK